MSRQIFKNYFSWLLVGLLIAIILLPYILSNAYQLRVWMLLLIYAVVALGLNLVVGLAGLISLGQAGLLAIGAYTASILATKFGFEFIPAALAAMCLTGIFGVVLAYPTLRVRGVYLAVITIAFGIIVENIAIEWSSVTGGTTGISNIPKIDFFERRLINV
jgi:ABC-type branched-subunit amino acid transport system permease subunit